MGRMKLKKKTKIVATIGPKTEDQQSLEKLLQAGMNVIRMNFSHGDFAEHQRKVNNGRKASEKTGIPVAFLQDLGGPKIRIGNFDPEVVGEDGKIELKKGKEFILTTDNVKGTDKIVSINYKKLAKEVKPGQSIFIHDGKIKTEVVKVSGNNVTVKIIEGGRIKGGRGVNIPNANLSISSLTPKDKKDLEFGIKNKVDFFALSFVRKPKDITDLRKILNKRGSKAGIVAKIETPEAIRNIDEIIDLTDVIMVARGDLAIEVPAPEVPLLQKEIIRKCNQAGKPVITATQMLESMINSSTPTRAEVSDVANAILDGTDAIMLSEETTLGQYPIKAVEMMSSIANHTENDFLHEQLLSSSERIHPECVAGSVTAHAIKVAKNVNAKYLIALTNSGESARMMSRHRSQLPILAFTPNDETYRQLLVSFGCWVFKTSKYKHVGEVLNELRRIVLKEKLAKKGDKVVIAAARPFGEGKGVNSILVEEI